VRGKKLEVREKPRRDRILDLLRMGRQNDGKRICKKDCTYSP
jgi:hypothetical protein